MNEQNSSLLKNTASTNLMDDLLANPYGDT